MPPRFTTMHRPGIASVIGDRIILDGTTIEEVKDCHRDTLKLCVEEANIKEGEILERQRLEREREEERVKSHKQKVEKLSNDIVF